MRFSTIFLVSMAALALVFAPPVHAQQQLDDPVWTITPADVDWLSSASTVRGGVVNPATGNLLIPSREGVLSVQVLNPATGAVTGQLDVTGVTGGTFALNKIAATSDGQIFASNLVTDASTANLKIYRWANEAAAPTVVFDGTVSAHRYGDSFNVSGSGGDVVAYSSGGGDNPNVAIFTMTDGSFGAPTLVGIPAGGAQTGLVKVAGQDSLWINSPTGGHLARKVSTVTGEVGTTISADLAHANLGELAEFTLEGRTYLAVGPGLIHDVLEINQARVVVLDVTDLADIEVVAETHTIGTTDNRFAPGGFVTYDEANNILVAGVTQNPIHAFSLDFLVPVSPPVAVFDPPVEEGLEVTLESGESTTATINIANVGDEELTFDFTEFSNDAFRALFMRDQHDPALDEVLNVPDFSVTGAADGGNTEVFNIQGGVTSSGTVVGFTFEGTVSGITGQGDWASDMRMVITSPTGASFDVGGFSGVVNPWQFQGFGSANDGTYVSMHLPIFDDGTGDTGDWNLQFTHDWNSDSAGTMNWSGVTVTLHKTGDAPGEFFVTDVSPASGTVAPDASVDVTVTFDATGFEEGTFTGSLTIETNEPADARWWLSDQEYLQLPAERRAALAGTLRQTTTYEYPVTMHVEDEPDVITIAEARALGVGATVTVEGTVSRAMGAFTYFQDETAGLAIRQPSGDFFDDVADGTITTGTEIQVTGTLSAFMGLLQINAGDLESYTVLGQGDAPEAQVVTFDDIEGDSHQSQLVHVASAWFPTASGTFAAATTYQATDASIDPATFDFRIPNAADTEVDGTPIPEDLFDFTGVVGHFNVPQLLAILETDIQPHPEAGLVFDPPISVGLEVTTDAGTTETGTFSMTNTTDAEINFEFPQFADVAREYANPANPLAHLMHRFPELADRSQHLEYPTHIPSRGEGGPDEFGYTWIDSDEPGGPAFEDIDISTTGQVLVFEQVPGTTLPPRDEGIVEVTLPFTFSFYGVQHTQVYVSPNGFVAMQPFEGTTFTARPFPATNSPNADFPGAMIAPMWFDFDGNRPVADEVYAQQLADGRFVIQWNDWPRWLEDNLNTLQLILYPGGAIKYQYLDINAASGVFGGPQIGIQNHDGTDGLTVASGLGYAQAGKAVLISAAPPFVSDVSPASGTIAAGASVDVTVTFDATNLLDGTFEGSLTIETDEPENGIYDYPVTLNVVGEPGCVIEPDPIAFGGVIVGFDATMEASVTNEGTADCVFTGAMIDEDDFSTDFEALTLEPGASTSFNVTFAPTSVGAITGTLTLEADNGEDVTAALTGTGLAPPVASVEPEAVDLLISNVDQVDTEILTLSNLGVEGAADLEFSISLVAARPAAARPGAALAAADTRGLATAGRGGSPEREAGVEGGPFPQTDFSRGEGEELIVDGSFEAGTPNPHWDEASTNFGTPLCDQSSCGFGGGTGPNTGAWWAWFGGTANAETGHVSQAVEIPAGSAELSFYLEIPVSNTPGWMRVSISGDVIFEVTDADAAAYPTYQQVVLDVSQYADGGVHEVKFEGQTQAGATTNFFVDDVSLLSTGPAILTIEPMSGTVAAGSSEEITLTATWDEDIEPGVYDFEVIIQTNDPETPTLVVDVTVVVTVVGAGEGASPLVFGLEQNYPNPFAHQTTIAYSLAEASAVRIAVYDVAGRRVATLVDAEQEAGEYSAVWDANGVASGVYFYRIQAGSYTQTLRALVVR